MNKLVSESIELWRKYRDKKEPWAETAVECYQFRYGKQLSDIERKQMEADGRAPIVVNRIHPAIETLKAMLTSKNPGFKAIAIEDSDVKVAHAYNAIMQYIWQISNGNMVTSNAIDDMCTMGLGWCFIYVDTIADLGRGELKMKDIDPLDVFPDPSSEDPLCDDASNIFISKLITRSQAEKLKPMYKSKIMKAGGNEENYEYNTGRDDNDVLVMKGDYDMSDIEEDGMVRLFDRFQKVLVTKYHITLWDGVEHLLTDDNIDAFLEESVFVIGNQIVRTQEEAQMLIQQGVQSGMPRSEAKVMTMKQLINAGVISARETKKWNIKETFIIGDQLLYTQVYDIEHYPIVPFMNLHTRTPYPLSDVHMVKDLQDYINKIRSLIIAHAATSTNVKILLPRGSANVEEMEEKWARPNAFIEVDFDLGAPVPVQPLPLPNELYANEKQAHNDIDHQFGLYEMSMGNSQNAPDTYKATLSIDEFGQRRIRTKLAKIETAITRIGQVIVDMVPLVYKTEKIIRLIEPNNITKEMAVNKTVKNMDEHGKETIEKINDLSTGKFDVIVTTGSMLPSNRYSELEFYLQAFQMGIIDNVEVLKKTDIFDAQGVLERMDQVNRLVMQNKELSDKIKGLEGDLQTREREVYHANQRAELEKFKAGLKAETSSVKKATALHSERLKDSIREIEKDKKRDEMIRKAESKSKQSSEKK